MISREDYNKALDVIEAYHKQLFDIANLTPAIRQPEYKEWYELKEGDKVKAVSLYASVTSLTIGKEYPVIYIGASETFNIIDDNGKKRLYRFYNKMFRPLN